LSEQKSKKINERQRKKRKRDLEIGLREKKISLHWALI
jgi:hypothetical protein